MQNLPSVLSPSSTVLLLFLYSKKSCVKQSHSTVCLLLCCKLLVCSTGSSFQVCVFSPFNFDSLCSFFLVHVDMRVCVYVHNLESAVMAAWSRVPHPWVNWVHLSTGKSFSFPVWIILEKGARALLSILAELAVLHFTAKQTPCPMWLAKARSESTTALKQKKNLCRKLPVFWHFPTFDRSVLCFYVFLTYRLRPFLYLLADSLAQRIYSLPHAKLTAVRTKWEWEQFWGIDKEGDGGILNLQSASSPLFFPLVPPLSAEGEKRGEGMNLHWGSGEPGWAVAAGSWALTTYVLQPELWGLRNGSPPNYIDWLPIRWHFLDGDCLVCVCVWGGVRREGGGPFLLGHPLSFFASEQPEVEMWLVGGKSNVSWFGEARTGDVALTLGGVPVQTVYWYKISVRYELLIPAPRQLIIAHF